MKGKFKILIEYWLVGWLILLFGRVAFMLFYVNLADVVSQSQFLPLAVYNAIRFDFQTLAYICALPTLLLIVHSFLRSDGWVRSFLRWYYTIVYTLVAVITAFDLGFYKNFGEHFNVTVFDFFNEGPADLVRAMWEDHPVVLYLLMLVLVFFVVFKLPVARRNLVLQGKVKKVSFVLWAVWILLLFAAMRGSLAEFPLQIEDLYVSPNKSLNDCVPNALYSLKKAIKEKATAFQVKSDAELLAEYGFESESEAWSVFAPGRTSPFECVPDSVVQRRDSVGKPNVVIMYNESWSGWLCDYAMSNYSEQLLCGMERHLSEDLYYRNYVSVENGTIASIERLVMSTPFPRIAASKYRYCHFDSSIADPFNASGYETFFISGIDQGWQNVGETLKNQGFNHIVSKYELLAEHPDYEYNSIGIFDHHMLDALVEDLNKESERRKMYFAVTITNHPPCVYPKSVPLPEIEDAFYDNPCFANSREVEERYIKGCQYSNLSVARFMDKLKASPAGDNTIVVITGDHNVRMAYEYSDDGQHVPEAWRTRVPLYIYLPKKYRGSDDGEYHYNTQLWGCHYDIIPTVAQFAFDSGVKYFSMGQNLFSDTLNIDNTFGSNVNGVNCSQKYMETARRKYAAQELLLRLHFQRFMFK